MLMGGGSIFPYKFAILVLYNFIGICSGVKYAAWTQNRVHVTRRLIRVQKRLFYTSTVSRTGKRFSSKNSAYTMQQS